MAAFLLQARNQPQVLARMGKRLELAQRLSRARVVGVRQILCAAGADTPFALAMIETTRKGSDGQPTD